MKLENLKDLNLPYYKHGSNPTDPMIVGDVVAEAKIATSADAWEWGYAKNGGDYHFSFQRGISQQEDARYPGSKNRAKDFFGWIVGIIDEGKVHKLAYATSRDHETKRINTLRLTNIDQIIEIWDYKLLHEKH